MEVRLREYRAARRRQQTVEDAKQKVISVKESLAGKFYLVSEKVSGKLHYWTRKAVDKVYPWVDRILDYFPTITWNMELEEETKVLIRSDSNEALNTDDTAEESNQSAESWNYFYLKWSIYILTWLTLFLFFVKLEFGAVFLIVSMLVGVCLNTRTKPRKKGEVSAYSVFNKNCESIDGTLTAQQFEREIMFGPGAVR